MIFFPVSGRGCRFPCTSRRPGGSAWSMFRIRRRSFSEISGGNERGPGRQGRHRNREPRSPGGGPFCLSGHDVEVPPDHEGCLYLNGVNGINVILLEGGRESGRAEEPRGVRRETERLKNKESGGRLQESGRAGEPRGVRRET